MGKKNKTRDNYWENPEEIGEATGEQNGINSDDKKNLDKDNGKVDTEQTPPNEEIQITGKKKKKSTKKSGELGQSAENNESLPENTKDIETSEDPKPTVEKHENGSTAAEATPEIAISGKKKKKTDKKADKETKAEKTTDKAEAKRKGGISKSLAEQIRKKQEDEERRKKEEEERIKREEEEEKKRLEEEQRLQEEKQKKKLEKKQREKERQAIQKVESEQRRLAEIREKLLQQGSTTVAALTQQTSSDVNQPPDKQKKKKPVYASKKKQQESTITDQTESTVTPEQSTPPVAEPIPEPKVEEVTTDSWEDIDEEKLAPKSQEVKESPAPQPTPDTAKPDTKPAEPKQKKDSSKRSKAAAEQSRGDTAEQEMRSPICCILGHVDTGKTKLLDKIRHTNVQEGEAGGITQQIGATFFPMEAIKEQTSKFDEASSISIKVPGLLIIDTPGHESFSNLRSRGTTLCDIAILVVDIMHGLEPQTIESINLLRSKKTPFIVALNKVDRIYGWKSAPNEPIEQALAKQDKSYVTLFEQSVRDTITAFAEQGFNANLYYKLKSTKDYRTQVSLVPTSAVEGTGIPDLLKLLVQLTQKLMADKLLYLSELQCTVLEVKVVEGLGTTIDVILVNGVLNEGDTIVVCGMNGPITTTIRALLTPQPMKEMRVKGSYVHHKTIQAAQGVKICAQDLDKAIAGSSLFVLRSGDDIQAIEAEVMEDLEEMKKRVDTAGRGVWVQASTLGSLEALLEFLKQSKIPVSGVNIGPVNKKDVMKASIMLEHNPEYAVILAFDVKIVKEARDLADEMGVKIFTAEIIYHLFDQFKIYMGELKTQKKDESETEAVFPCRLRILPDCIFNKKNPIVLGVEVLEGSVKVGTPLVVPSKEFIELGKVTSVEANHKAIERAKKGAQVAIKIEQKDGEQQKVYARHFDHNDELVSKISRKSVDLLKENFREELDQDEVRLLKKLKEIFDKANLFDHSSVM